MKRAFFLLTCLWVMCNLCRAQDIFTSGYYLDASGFKAAAVFKNDAIVYQRSESGLDLYASSIVLDTVSDAVYFGKLAIYPNPAQESIAIDGIDEGDVIDVFNVEGRLVRKETAGFDRIIDVRGLPTGLYWVQCGRKGVPFVKE